MMTAEKRKKSRDEIAKRAALRKASPKLRHTPNASDLRVASDHAKIMIYHQYQTIDSIGEGKA